MTTLSEFTTEINKIITEMNWWDRMEDFLLEYEDRRKIGDGGYAFAKNTLKKDHYNLCLEFFKSNPTDFIQFCKTNKEFRDNVYKQWLIHDIDNMVHGKSDGYFAESFPKDKGTIETNDDENAYNYNVTWRGLFTASIDKVYL
jgi:hypothetical protein